MKNSKKIALVFPGIGYHVDKPLLYYSKKLAAKYGFEVFDVSYGNFLKGVKGDPKKMKECFDRALSQSEEMLRDVEFSKYDQVLVLSKSIGTAVAVAYTEKHVIAAHHIYYTPVGEPLLFMKQPGIAFHGTSDSWSDTDELIEKCREQNIPLHFIEGGNHSLEIGDIKKDLENLRHIMELTETYIREVSNR